MANDHTNEIQIDLATFGIATREIKTTKAVGSLVKVLVGVEDNLVIVSFKHNPGYKPFANMQDAGRSTVDQSTTSDAIIQPTGKLYEVPLELAKLFVSLAFEEGMLPAGQTAVDAVNKFKIPEYPVYN